MIKNNLCTIILRLTLVQLLNDNQYYFTKIFKHDDFNNETDHQFLDRKIRYLLRTRRILKTSLDYYAYAFATTKLYENIHLAIVKG